MEVHAVIDYPVEHNALEARTFQTITAQSDSDDIALLKENFGPLWHIFYDIAKCESTNLQFYPGSSMTVHSKTNDWGYLQINDNPDNQRLAAKLGLDYKGSMKDNIKMARALFDIQGFNAWYCSPFPRTRDYGHNLSLL